MKKDILDRYERTEDGEIIIEASVRSIEELYDNFDLTAPYLKKDLDQDFVDYLIDSVREIGPRRFVIRISYVQGPDEIRMQRVRKSIYNYILYLRELENRELRRMWERFLILSGIGLCLLALAVWVNRLLAHDTRILTQVFAEGLTVAAWVSMWEALATLLLEWRPHRVNRRIHDRIMAASVVFRHAYSSESSAAVRS
jgi:hypothetical protein